MIKRKSQSWSIDIALGVIVFVAAFFIFYTLLNADQSTKAANLRQEASNIIRQITSKGEPLRVVDNNNANLSRLNALKNTSYSELKKRLRVEGDFCIYLEDENGNVVLINNSFRGIGSPNINLSGAPCSQK